MQSLKIQAKAPQPTQRVNWSKQLSKKEAKKYTVQNILKGNDGWNPEK